MMNTTKNIEIVDSDQDLIIQHANIQNLFESSCSEKQETTLTTLSADEEDNLRRFRGVIIDKNNTVVHRGSFFPYEFTENEQDKCVKKMEQLNHQLEDMNIEYSYEGTIIRIFYYKQWYISTHRKLDSGRSKWGSNKSFKFLFEKGLEESYNISLEKFLNTLNLRCQYTFMLMADENTRFVCTPSHPKKVYFVESNDNALKFKMDTLPKPEPLASKSVDNVFNFIKNMTYPYTYQGLLLVHKNGSQYRIISDEYAMLFQTRNNEQSIPYRYLQLKNQNNFKTIELLKKLFPEYNSTFEAYENYVSKLADIIYKEYQLRKERSLLPQDLTTVQQIDQKIYLFIKNRLLVQNNRSRSVITHKIISELLWLEEPSNLNHMIRMVKHNENAKLGLRTPTTSTVAASIVAAPKKMKIKYTKIPFECTCKKSLAY